MLTSLVVRLYSGSAEKGALGDRARTRSLAGRAIQRPVELLHSGRPSMGCIRCSTLLLMHLQVLHAQGRRQRGQIELTKRQKGYDLEKRERHQSVRL